MRSLAFRWSDGGLVPVRVVESRRLPYRVQVPGRIRRPAGVKPLPAQPTPIFDGLAAERGHPLAREGVLVGAGAR